MIGRETQLKRLFVGGVGGDADAYRRFLIEASHGLRSYVRRQLERTGRPVDDAEDIVQEVILAVHLKRHTFEGDTPITAWLHAIARYKLVDFLRSTKRHSQTLDLDDVDAADWQAIEAVEASFTARRLLETLPQKLRGPLVMMKVEGLSVAETAAQTGMSQSAVKVSVHRSLKALAARFSPR